MKVIPANVVRFSFPNELSKPGFLKWGWELCPRYTTKIYPLSWLKFSYKRYLLKKKNFKSQPASSNKSFFENQTLIDQFLESLVKQRNMTNFSFELLSWKLSLDKNLRIQLFDDGSRIIALLVYSIQCMDDYTLLLISDLLRLEDEGLQPIIKIKIKQFVRDELIDEVQYSGNDHNFLGKLFTAVKSTSGDMIIHSQYGNKNDVDFMEHDMRISKLVTDQV